MLLPLEIERGPQHLAVVAGHTLRRAQSTPTGDRPRLITNVLRQQGEHNLQRRQSWLRTRRTSREHSESPQQ